MTGNQDIYLGRSDEGHWIFADVRITPADPERIVQFTDHSTGPKPTSLGIMFTVVDGARGRHRPQHATDAHDRWWLQSGQVPPIDRRISDPLPHTRLIENAWLDWHLNDMKPACDHMTDEMLNPADDVLDEYIRVKTEERGEWREKYSPAFYGRRDALQKWRLDNVVCPETGYKWGHAWLARHLPDELVHDLMPYVGRS